MKNEICLQVDRLLDAIQIQKKWLDESTDKLLKLRNENAVQGQMLDSILSLRLNFERINPVPTMSKLTKQCIDAYNTCIELQRKMIDKTMSELNKKKQGNKNGMNLFDKNGNLMLFDAAGNRVQFLNNPNFVYRSRHNKMLGELTSALTMLDTMSQALQSAKALIEQMDKAGLINDEKGELKNYQTKTDALLVSAKVFMQKYVIKEEKKNEEAK